MPRTPRTIDLGNMRVTLLDGGSLRLDGGAMFGIIPRVLWEKVTPADEQHRISLACNSLLVEWTGQTDRRLLIEVGCGNKFSEKEQAIFAIDPQHWIAPTLEAQAIEPASITDVAVTHLHFDHAGALTRDDGQAYQPTFPKARVHVQRLEFDDARVKFGIMTATYRDENIDAISAAEAWNLLDGPTEIAPGVHSLPTPGHTRGHQSIVIRGTDQTLVFPGDLMPTAAHIGAAYNMAFDLFPLENRDSKRSLLEQAADQNWLIVLVHEQHHPVARVVRDGSWYRLDPA